jgi:uncharacterized iron-regulated protein
MTRRIRALAFLIGALLAQGCTLQPAASRPDRFAGEPPTPAVALVVVGLGSASDPMPAMLRRLGREDPMPDFLLLGEVHDHPLHHRLRQEWLARIAGVQPVAIAMEQFDEERQADLVAARSRGVSARDLAQATGFRFNGWDWAFYEPFVRLALDQGHPLFAANLSAERARAFARSPATGQAVLAEWSDVDQAIMQGEIDRGHCGMLPAAALGPMVRAQMARDATMATVMLRAHRETGLPVVLLAGNGHVRRDLGVPRHLLAQMPDARILSVGFLERGQIEPVERDEAPLHGSTARYDLAVLTPVHQRPDPCEAFRQTDRKATPDHGSNPAAMPGTVRN